MGSHLNIENAIKKVPLFFHLTQDEITPVASFFKPIQFKKGEVITRQGKEGLGLYIILKGKVSVNVRLPGDVYEKVAELKKNDIFGEAALLDNSPASASILALEATSCCVLDGEHFKVFRIGYPRIAYKVALAISKIVCERLRQINSKVGGGLSDILPTHMQELKKTKKLLGKPVPKKYFSFIHTLPFFKELCEEDFFNLLPYLEYYEYPKNHIIFQQEELPKGGYFVLQGAVQVVLKQKNHYSKLKTLGPGSLFGFLSLIDKELRSATAYARESTVCLMIPTEKIEQLYKEHPILYYRCFVIVISHFVTLQHSADKLLLRLRVESHESQNS